MRHPAALSTAFVVFAGVALSARADDWTQIGPTLNLPASVIAVSATDVYDVTIAGAFRSADGGLTWVGAGAGLPVSEVLVLAVDPGTLPPTICPAPCAYPSRSLLYAGTGGSGVFRSTNKGQTWRPVNTGLTSLGVNALAVDAAGAVYAATGTGVFKSADFGATWVRRSSGLEAVVVGNLAPEPGSNSVIYAATKSGIFRSTDGGEHWVPKSNGLPDLSDLTFPAAASVGGSGTVYAGTGHDGVFRSSDRGETWVPANGGLTGVAITCLVADPVRPFTVYAGTGYILPGAGQLQGIGIYKTDNGGETWTEFNEGLPERGARTYALAIDDAGRALYTAHPKIGFIPPFLFRRVLGEDGGCPTQTALCLNSGRFRVEVAWRSTNVGGSGVGQAMPLTSDTGAFWFFEQSNIELVVKVLDGRTVNGKFWVFYGALSNVEYTITVTDTATGAVKTYFNPEGNLASVADTDAF